jgi:hypothetical protein
MYRHIVMWKVKEGEAREVCEQMAQKLYHLTDQIDEIEALEVGINELESDAAFDIVLISSFENQQAYQAYAIHPLHQEVVVWIKERVGARAVVDYVIDTQGK